jgi:CO dehydrogenase nickel-insertion accessory protein CooC1
MSAGPHNEKILKEGYCSHSLGTPLKIYLPFVDLGDNDFIVLDEKAGSDGVGTGISKGLDIVFVVIEPTRYALKAASQITDILKEFGVPYEYVINKIFSPEDEELVKEYLEKEPIAKLNINRDLASLSEYKSNNFPQAEELEKIRQHVKKIKEVKK